MCQVAKNIAEVRDINRDSAAATIQWEGNELFLHLSIECEKYLRRHEARCPYCILELQGKTA